jgi:transposase-like protein
MVCDGTFLQHRTGIYAMMNAHPPQLIYAAFDMPEGSRELAVLYPRLADTGLSPSSVTVDGNPQQIECLRQQWPRLIIQRCIVHVQRQGLSWCRQQPNRTDAKHLRRLFLQLSSIKTHTQVRQFKAQLLTWEKRFGALLEQTRERGWVVSDIIRARSMLLKALPDLFHFISHPCIPKSTNLLEGYYSRLKERYQHHRGLAVHHRQAYFRWYFHLISR